MSLLSAKLLRDLRSSAFRKNSGSEKGRARFLGPDSGPALTLTRPGRRPGMREALAFSGAPLVLSLALLARSIDLLALSLEGPLVSKGGPCSCFCLYVAQGASRLCGAVGRSEERRVGKEGRCWLAVE